mmetsp:Transcript_14064/g.19571  ORF Transcript_14064/g.19571 Transcript_14064/m.19571 type:complete len:114 (-) Transcript_14064:146-487(-)
MLKLPLTSTKTKKSRALSSELIGMSAWTRRDLEAACDEAEHLQEDTLATVAALQEDIAPLLLTEEDHALVPDPDLDHHADLALDPIPEAAAATERDPEAHLLATTRGEEVKLR